MSHALAQLLCLGGFALLAAALRGPPPARRRALRAGGFALLLLLALAPLVAWRGWGFGLVAWSGHLSLAAGLVHLLRIGRARRALPPA